MIPTWVQQFSKLFSVATIVSGAVRARMANAAGINTSVNNFISYQSPETTNAHIKNPMGWVGSRYLSQATGIETSGTQAMYYVYEIIPVSNGVSQDQTGKTVVKATWNAVQSDTPVLQPDGTMNAPIRDNTWAASTFALFTAAGGSVITTNGHDAITIPAGWSCAYDPMTGVDIPAGTTYIQRCLASATASTTSAIVGTIQCNGVDDWSKVAASDAASNINLANWTGVSSLNSSTAPFPFIIYGTGDAGVETDMIIGDSIATGEPGDNRGDANRCCGYVKRAFNKRGYNWFAATAPSTSATQLNNNSHPMINWMLGGVSKGGIVFNEHGHNPTPGVAWGTGSTSLPNGDGNLYSYLRVLTKSIRAVTNATAKVLWTSLTPTQTGGINASSISITTLTSVGTTATSTGAAHGRTTGDWVLVYSAEVPGYNGVVQVTVVNSTTFTYTLPNGGTGLAPTTTASKLATTAGVGGGQFTNLIDFINRTASYAGVPFDTASGDPDIGIDTYAAAGGSHNLYPDMTDTNEGTHPMGNSTTGTNNAAYIDGFASAVSTQLLAKVGR